MWRSIHFKTFGVRSWKMPNCSSIGQSTEDIHYFFQDDGAKRMRSLHSLSRSFSEWAGEKGGNQSNFYQEMVWNWWLGFPDLFLTFLNCIQICWIGLSGEIIFSSFSLGRAGRCGVIKHHWALNTKETTAVGCAARCSRSLASSSSLSSIYIYIYKMLLLHYRLTCPILQLGKSDPFQRVHRSDTLRNYLRPLSQPYYSSGLQVQA